MEASLAAATSSTAALISSHFGDLFAGSRTTRLFIEGSLAPGCRTVKGAGYKVIFLLDMQKGYRISAIGVKHPPIPLPSQPC